MSTSKFLLFSTLQLDIAFPRSFFHHKKQTFLEKGDRSFSANDFPSFNEIIDAENAASEKRKLYNPQWVAYVLFASKHQPTHASVCEELYFCFYFPFISANSSGKNRILLNADAKESLTLNGKVPRRFRALQWAKRLGENMDELEES